MSMCSNMNYHILYTLNHKSLYNYFHKPPNNPYNIEASFLRLR